MQKIEKLPVIFRQMPGKQYEADGVTAVFLTLEWAGGDMTCYAHVGQHGACSLGWYRRTRPAKPHEYEDLLRELRGIYEDPNCAPDRVQLVVYKRRTGKAAGQ